MKETRKKTEPENTQAGGGTVIPQREELMDALSRLEGMAVGQADRLFCNAFLSEAVRLLKNSVFLYENGCFDCAFYSIRQAAETCNNMLYLANGGAPALDRWNKKQYFPVNQKVLRHLSEIDEFYSDVKDAIPGFFADYAALTGRIHKIVHKQGFDTFYVLRRRLLLDGMFQQEDETALFAEFLIQTICLVMILCIIADPISLALSDEDLSTRLHFAPMTEPADAGFLEKHAELDLVGLIKATPYFAEFSRSFREKEKMLPATLGAVRHQVFDLERLPEIESQASLLGTDEKLILELLLNEIPFTHIHPDCVLLGYGTTIPSNYQPAERSSLEYDRYLHAPEAFNVSYHTIYRSIVMGPRGNWLIEHNDAFGDREIETIHRIFHRHIESARSRK